MRTALLSLVTGAAFVAGALLIYLLTAESVQNSLLLLPPYMAICYALYDEGFGSDEDDADDGSTEQWTRVSLQ